METISHTTHPSSGDDTAHRTPSDIGDLAPDDPRTAFAAAVRIASTVIGDVRPEQLELATPCDDFDVRRLLGHLTGVLLRVANLGRGGQVLDTPAIVEGVSDDGWSTAWQEAAHAVQDVWSDPAHLDAVFVLPWVTAPGRDLLAMYTSEITVHTWDLARSTGRTVRWDDRAVAVSLAAMTAVLPPSEERIRAFEAAVANLPAGSTVTPPFGAVVEVPAGASPIDRLVAWTGRQP